MKNKIFKLICILFFLNGLFLNTSNAQDINVRQRPNVIIIYADDLGYGDLSFMGATKVNTPNIDKLAEGGCVFTDAHSVSAVCTPSRYALLTGQYPFRINNFAPVFCQNGLIIDTSLTTLPDIFKEYGYQTACIGKWHLGFGAERPDWNGALKPGPLELGFDYYFGVPVVNSHPPFVYVENHHVVGQDPDDPFILKQGIPTYSKEYPLKFAKPKSPMWSVGGGKKANELYVDEEVMSKLTQNAQTFIVENSKKPFFLYFATTAIHHPFTPHPKFKGTSQCGIYGDFIHELDWSVGEIIKTLKDQNLIENTLVIFTSDNGGMLNEGGMEAWEKGHRLNGDLLGFKFGAWEGGHRIPFITYWPRVIEPGQTSDKLIANVDLLATFAELFGRKLKNPEGPDSFSLLNTLLGNNDSPGREHLLIQAFHKNKVAIRFKDWIYIPGQGSGGFGNGLKEIAKTASINSDITLEGIIKPNAPSNQLYNLKNDFSQTKNVIIEYPEVTKQLDNMLNKYKDAEYTRGK
jgi:arylsulfatase A-like enzyme